MKAAIYTINNTLGLQVLFNEEEYRYLMSKAISLTPKLSLVGTKLDNLSIIWDERGYRVATRYSKRNGVTYVCTFLKCNGRKIEDFFSKKRKMKYIDVIQASTSSNYPILSFSMENDIRNENDGLSIAASEIQHLLEKAKRIAEKYDFSVEFKITPIEELEDKDE